MRDAKIYGINEEDRYERGAVGAKRVVVARFMVGEFGPFSAEVPKGDGWEPALRSEVQKTVNSVNALNP